MLARIRAHITDRHITDHLLAMAVIFAAIFAAAMWALASIDAPTTGDTVVLDPIPSPVKHSGLYVTGDPADQGEGCWIEGTDKVCGYWVHKPIDV